AFKPHPDMPDEDVTFDYIFDNVVIRGSVNRVVDRILELHDHVGDFGTLLYCGKDWADPRLGRKSMELMAEKVMPAVNAALARSRAGEWGRRSKNNQRKGDSPCRPSLKTSSSPACSAFSRNPTRPPRAASSSCRRSSASTRSSAATRKPSRAPGSP